MAEIKCAMWNCSGILPTSSAEEKMDFFRSCSSSPFDILFLIETHHKLLTDVSPLLQAHLKDSAIVHTEASSGDPYAGIIVLVNKNYELLSEAIIIPGRLLNLRIKSEKKEYNISVFYGYTGQNASQANMKCITDELAKFHSTSDNNIILGDFNFVDNDLDRSNKMRTGMNQTDNSLAKIWSTFTDSLDLSDPFRVRNPRKRAFSYLHTQNNSKSRIDRIYVNDENCGDVLHYSHVHTNFTKAHRIVKFTLKDECERGPGFWKMNTSILHDPAFKVLIESTVSDVASLNIVDPIERWQVFIETVRIDSRAYSSKKRAIEKKLRDLCLRNIEVLEQNPMLNQDPKLHKEYEYNLSMLNDWQRKQIEGFQTRIKTQPRLEPGEPNISFFADLEKKECKKKNISQLKTPAGILKSDVESMKEIATDYYTKLFDIKATDNSTALRLLRNIKTQISPQQRANLDKLITPEELEDAVAKLRRNKSPGPDGIPAEFYQTYWYILGGFFLDFVNAVKRTSFPRESNTSVTSLFYKNRGDICDLAYYRPIALMNVDVKILTKLLSMRLKFVLPTIIHESQTAVYGRQIGNSVHLVRDIIDYANASDEGAALLFIDQEKAFDRVSHSLLFDVMKAFGFGDYFISWIQLLYSNAFTRININGFLTKEIPLKCGVRQGCPLSALLYVLVIELLAIQLRSNPNIVGFEIQGKRIISTHFADDAVIKITQNRCFKEVYKDLKDYELATGAKVNLEKTVGLWVGKWKGRTDDPFLDIDPEQTRKIEWTNKNVKYLGVYVGNDRPDVQTFSELVPKMRRRLNFWKPLALPLLGKSRVIEIYHASKLFYASNFYPIPPDIESQISNAFMDYITFPKNGKHPQVSKREMEKLRLDGGLKLINISLKSQTPKVHWLMRLITDKNLQVHLELFNSLIGLQNGQLRGQDIIFCENSYIKRNLKTNNSFYKEALDSITKLNVGKHYNDIMDEVVFFNPIFTTTRDDEVHEDTIKPFQGNQILSKIRTYGDLLAAESNVPPKLAAAVRKKIHSIHNIRDSDDEHSVYATKGGKIYTFGPSNSTATQYVIYAELIQAQSGDHIYQTKWVDYDEGRIRSMIDWDKVWESVHVPFYTEELKSTIWEQIHLNFYTTYNYNKWHKALQPCPLCHKIPEDIYHIFFDCKFTKVMWKRVEKVLLKITPTPVTDIEKAVGLQPREGRPSLADILRNWITFSLRHFIMLEERRAYYIKDYHLQSVEKFFTKFNFKTQEELRVKKLLFDHRGASAKFKNLVTYKNAVASVAADGSLLWKDLM